MNEATHEDVTKGTYARAALAVAGRTLRTTFRNPALLMPPLVAPLIFFAVIGAGLGALGKAPGFDFPGGPVWSWLGSPSPQPGRCGGRVLLR